MESIKCDVCEESFTTHQALSRHKRMHSSPSEIEKICEICQKTVSCIRKDNFDRHVKSCTKKAAGRAKPNNYCKQCDKGFDTKQHLENHNRSKNHNKTGPKRATLTDIAKKKLLVSTTLTTKQPRKRGKGILK